MCVDLVATSSKGMLHNFDEALGIGRKLQKEQPGI